MFACVKRFQQTINSVSIISLCINVGVQTIISAAVNSSSCGEGKEGRKKPYAKIYAVLLLSQLNFSWPTTAIYVSLFHVWWKGVRKKNNTLGQGRTNTRPSEWKKCIRPTTHTHTHYMQWVRVTHLRPDHISLGLLYAASARRHPSTAAVCILVVVVVVSPAYAECIELVRWSHRAKEIDGQK